MTQRFTSSAVFALTGALVLGLAACGPRGAEQPVDATQAPAPETGSPSDNRGGWGGPMTLTSMQMRADERFAALDADNDGVVTTAELETAADDRGGPGGRAGGRGGGRGLAQADADGDGRITREEARAQVAERFARMDTNNDGVISDDERPQRGDRRGGQDAAPLAAE